MGFRVWGFRGLLVGLIIEVGLVLWVSSSDGVVVVSFNSMGSWVIFEERGQVSSGRFYWCWCFVRLWALVSSGCWLDIVCGCIYCN